MTDRIDLPPGPALLYVTTPGPDGIARVIEVDREPVAEERERAICRALLYRAIKLSEEADREQGGRS